MQLTRHADYALRILIHLAAHPDRLVGAGEIATAYGVSRHHLLKVGSRLGRLGYVEAVRGRNGGLRLGKAPEEIVVGAVVRRMEPEFDLAECFDRARNTCPIAPACGFKDALARAREAFLQVLDGCTLADFARRRGALEGLWLGPQRDPNPPSARRAAGPLRTTRATSRSRRKSGGGT